MVDINGTSDKFAPRSSVGLYSWFNPHFLYAQQSLERQIISILKDCGIFSLRGLKLLDLGCGYGHWLRQFVKWGVAERDVTGIEIVPEKVEIARRKCFTQARIECCSADELPFENETFDIVFQATMFTSILDDGIKQKAASEMMRVVKSSGVMLWYDFQFNNSNNDRVKGIKKAEISRLFPGCDVELRRVTLAPPLGRRVAPLSFLLFHLLESIPFLRSHYLAAITAPNKAA